jgi:hypothetical protein
LRKARRGLEGAAAEVTALYPIDFVPINPRATYLRTNGDNALPASPIDLATRGIVPGQSLLLRDAGAFVPGGGAAETARAMGAVFSASPSLLAASNLNHIPDALSTDAPAIVTGGTYFGLLPTDGAVDCERADRV